MEQNIDQSAQKVIIQGPGNLLGQFFSRIGLLTILLITVCAVVLAVHWPALSAQALSFDDDQYLTENSLVQNPSWRSARRFLTEVLEPSTVFGYYQPLTMLSLMLDYAISGQHDNLRPFHRTNLAMHVANTALIIWFLYLLFGRIWLAAAVGLLFGLHPMTVEPIAWVGERKTLLAAFFSLWCLVLYIHFARTNNWKLYASALVLYVLALMSKPTSVPLPVLMLLMDYWPLRRLGRRAVFEKLPFFVVGGIFAIITYISQSRVTGLIPPGEQGPVYILLALCHNIVFYPYKMLWPVNLTSHYSFPKPLGLSDPMVLAGVVGTCILIPSLLISLRWTRVWLTGWLFFFAAILPTMQIIRFSDVIASDKFAYLPSVGLLIVLASFLGWFCSTGSSGKAMAKRVATLIIVLILAGAETVATRRYLVHWRNTVSIHKYMLSLTPDVVWLNYNLGRVLKSQGKLDEAIHYLHQAMKYRLQKDISYHRQALQVKPNDVEAHTELGIALSRQGQFDEAVRQYRQALKLNPNYAEAHNNLGNALLAQGKLDEAINHYRQALRIQPDFTQASKNLDTALKLRDKRD